MFGSLEVFFFNNGLSQGLMEMFVDRGTLKGSVEGFAGKGKFDPVIDVTKKIFDFDLSAAKLSSNFGSVFEPVSNKPKPIHPAEPTN